MLAGRAARRPWGIVSLAVCVMCAAGICSAEPGNIRLNDLWEDTAATRNLAYQFRIYKRKELPSHLHQQLRLYFVYPEEAKPSKRRPAVVFIHGGGWGAGNPDQWFPQCRYFIGYGLDHSVARTIVEIDRYLATLGWLDGRPLLSSSGNSK